MNQKNKSFVLLGASIIMVIAVGGIYISYLHDKPLIDEQQRQAELSQQRNLTPDQMVSGVKQFLNDTTSNIKQPPPLP